jgi:hypothetical protein
MQTQKIALLGTVILVLSSLGACSDFLDEKPKSSFTLNQYFSDPDHARAAVNALYRKGFPELYSAGSAYAGPNIMLGGYISGLFDNEYKGQEQYVKRCQELNIIPSNEAGSRTSDVWDPLFVAINRANTAIKYIPLTPGLQDDEQTYLLAQAHFFRALNYFHLVKFFGDVPLLTEPVKSLEDPLYVPRTPSAEVYACIESDLKIAVEGLKDNLFTVKNDPVSKEDFCFRVTKHTANAFLANVYLQWSGYPLQGDHYADAVTAAKSVINSGKHALASDFSTLRTEDVNPEIIYAFEFKTGIADAGWWPSYSATGQVEGYKPAGSDEKLFKWDIMKNVYGVTNLVYHAYDPANDRRVQEKQFFYTSYSNYTYDFSNLDSRLAPVCNFFFFEEDAMLSGAKPDKDRPIIRYAEVLLTAAEAIAQSEGVTPEALDYLNQVRTRAGLPALAATSKEAFIQEVWAERLREFPLEFKAWDDIQRTHMYPQTSEAEKGKVTWTLVIGATNPWGATFEEKHLLWPVSDSEMQRNPALEQNPGY